MSAIRTRRLRVSRRKKRCSQCQEVAVRFVDDANERSWFCKIHFDLNSKENEDAAAPETP
jgi:hypothetical protein